MIVGTLILVFGTMMTSISTQYYQYILAQGILTGVGIGTVYVCCRTASNSSAHAHLMLQVLSVSLSHLDPFFEV